MNAHLSSGGAMIVVITDMKTTTPKTLSETTDIARPICATTMPTSPRGTIPTPIGEDEWKVLQKRMGVEEPKFKVDFELGELVRVTDGPFKDYEGKVGELDEAKGKVKVMVTIFGRETPVELDFLQVAKL